MIQSIFPWPGETSHWAAEKHARLSLNWRDPRLRNSDSQQLFGHSTASEPSEAVNYRVRATVRVPKFAIKRYKRAVGSADAAKIGERDMYFDPASGITTPPVYDRAALSPGHEVPGPTIVDQLGSTTVVYAAQRAVVGDYLNLIITP